MELNKSKTDWNSVVQRYNSCEPSLSLGEERYIFFYGSKAENLPDTKWHKFTYIFPKTILLNGSNLNEIELGTCHIESDILSEVPPPLNIDKYHMCATFYECGSMDYQKSDTIAFNNIKMEKYPGYHSGCSTMLGFSPLHIKSMAAVHIEIYPAVHDSQIPPLLQDYSLNGMFVVRSY